MLESSRENVARCLGCEPEQVFFVSSATEACRIAITRMTESCKKVHVTKVEHAAVTSMTDRKVYSDRRTIIVVLCISTLTMKLAKYTI